MLKVREAIILAGGLGTRLREAVPDLPKCMAPVAGRPFLYYVINALLMQDVRHLIFSLGYRHEVIEAYLSQSHPTLSYSFVVEAEPLGTGGAIQLALSKAETNEVLVLNGDTLFEVDLSALAAVHDAQNALCTLALKPMQNFDRYGLVQTNAEGRVLSFEEKKPTAEGVINGGVYLLNKAAFLAAGRPQKFSFEKDFLEASVTGGQLFASVQTGYFIDIGIPQDYTQAQTDLAPGLLRPESIDKSWTLFLDRDGVINEERVDDYVQNWSQFIFSAGVLHTFRQLTERFGKTIVVSNQRGVGRGIMTEAALQSIHLEMQREVALVGGHIDRIYYCTAVDNTDFYRKPNPGMALRAREEFPEIDFSKSIMVGNKPSDMRFGRTAGMFTVFVKTTNPHQAFPHPDIDLIFPSLEDFASLLAHTAGAKQAVT